MTDSLAKLNIPGVQVTRAQNHDPNFLAWQAIGRPFNPESRVVQEIRKKAKQEEESGRFRVVAEELAQPEKIEHRKKAIAAAIEQSEREATARAKRREANIQKFRNRMKEKGISFPNFKTTRKLSGEGAA